MTCEEWIAGIRLRGGDCHNKATDVALVGDGKAIMAQMNAALAGRQWFHPKESPWRQMISNKSAEKPNTLIWGARYDRMMDAFGCKAFLSRTRSTSAAPSTKP